MRRSFTALIILFLSAGVSGADSVAPVQESVNVPVPQTGKPVVASSLRPEDVNVFIGADVRLFTMMAALNIAGTDYESPGRGGSAWWKQLHRGLVHLEPHLRARLVDYFRVHLRQPTEGPPRIGGYVALSLTLSPPPVLSVGAARGSLPKDVLAAADVEPLIREFYASRGVAKSIRATMRSYQEEVDEARHRLGVMVFEALQYLHTVPILKVSEWATPEETKSASGKQGKGHRRHRPQIRQRTRRLFVLLNPLDASTAVYVRNDILNGADSETDRRPGDDYFVVLGSASQIDLVRPAFLRFVLEPLSQRFARGIRQQAASITHLAQQVVGPEVAQGETAFSIFDESLVWAVEARLRRLQIERQWEQELLEAERRRTHARSRQQKDDASAAVARIQADIRKQATLADEETIYDLSTHYKQGAVLVFHFYEKLIPWERAGVDISSYYDEMVRAINFEREAARAESFDVVRARVESRHKERRQTAAEYSEAARQLRKANRLIQERDFQQAEALLNAILKKNPDSARAQYGLGQVVSQMASRINPSKSEDPDAAWNQLVAQLGRAMEHYRRAVALASQHQEVWLLSQSHVAIGKILEFIGQPQVALKEYREAIELGDVPGGAYSQAKAALLRASGQ